MVSKDMHEPQEAQETVSKHYKEYAFCKAPFTSVDGGSSTKSISAHGRGLFSSCQPNTREKRPLLAGNKFYNILVLLKVSSIEYFNFISTNIL